MSQMSSPSSKACSSSSLKLPGNSNFELSPLDLLKAKRPQLEEKKSEVLSECRSEI